MVSFWPWGSSDSSPASFEKTLSTLSKKIAATQSKLDRLRSSGRRVKVLWTLYLSFAYLIYAIVLMLVVGYKNLGSWEWTGIAGGPVLIFLIRTLTSTYFTFRIESLETRLKDQQSERATTIQKLKDATKYDSTLQLLEKYGGEKPRMRRKNTREQDEDASQEKKGRKGGRQSLGGEPGTPVARINLPPPPTANIQRPTSAPGPSTPGTPLSQHPYQQYQQSLFPPPRAHSASPAQYPDADFASNVDDSPPFVHHDYNPGPPQWYDRVFDLILGEDETAPKNRIVLICRKCRMVNGQAPPGTKTLAEVGQWKCMSCHTMNGEMDEGQKIMREVLGNTSDGVIDERGSEGSSDVVKIDRHDAHDESGDEVEETPVVEDHNPKKRPGKGRNKSQMIP